MEPFNSSIAAKHRLLSGPVSLTFPSSKVTYKIDIKVSERPMTSSEEGILKGATPKITLGFNSARIPVL